MSETFTYDELNEGQKNVFDSILECIENKSGHITVNGPAGTGKTTLTKAVIDHLIKKGETGIMLAAPTHQAKKILSKLAGLEAQTIHSLLKINPTTYEDSTTFEQSDIPDLAECRVLFCDEASMYDRELFRILMTTVPSWCTIIGLGDIAQLRPVAPGSSVPELSAFFFNDKFKQVALTEVMRSNAPIIKVATDIRKGGWITHNVVDGHGVHSLVKENGRSIANFFGKYFEIVKDADDLFDNRMLAFTNGSVNNLNKLIRKKLYETQEDFIKHEVLVMQEPVMKTMTFEGKKFTETLFNNGELVRIMDCQQSSTLLTVKGFDQTQEVKFWRLELRGVDSDIIAQIQVISDEQEMNKFQFFLSKAADSFKNHRGDGKRPNWKSWWATRNAFHKVKPLPCGTIHKSQGMTVDSVFLYTPCIHKADASLAQQLLYVGATRARHDVYFI